ncbi:metallophosphoesterase family protein, partial [Psychrobacter sp. 1Y4]|uniref:metallophosphoesterase family protein n=1 Tax=Psychrobacter sp. 1Y4 TaxID=3453575 RepID=UPI003F4464E8
IRGNQDRQIYEATETEIANNPTMDFIVRELPKDAIEWMRALLFDCHLSEDVYLCHGTPTDDIIYLLEDIVTGAPTVRSDSNILSLLNGIASPVIVCGHTHIPRTVTLSSGQMVINSGSVGYPAYEDDLPVVHKMQTYSPHANYALIKCIETQQGKHWQTEHVKVAYNHEAAANLALENG